MSRDDLRARFLAMHDPARVRRAEDAALFACALKVYEGAAIRRERAREAVLAALEAEKAAAALEAEWCSIVHGLALQYARSVDRDESPALASLPSDPSGIGPEEHDE